MGEFAAKQGDRIEGTDTHEEIIPPPTGGTVKLPNPFKGALVNNLSADVFIEGMPAAFEGSVAENNPKHMVHGSNTGFADAPDNLGEISIGSPTVFINGNPAGRNGDPATTCNVDNKENSSAVVVDQSTVSFG